MLSVKVRTLFVGFLTAYLVVLVSLDVLSIRTGRSGGALINGDAKGYYAWLRSIALDHDVDFRNDYALIYPPEPPPPIPELTPRGLVPDKYPIGVAIVELPGFVVGHLTAKVLGFPANGVTTPYQIAVTLWLQLVCLGSLLSLWAAMVRVGAREDIAALGIASALLATNLIQYVAKPAWAHGPGLAVLCLAYYLLVTARDTGAGRRMLAIGALLGLALIIRPSNVALAPFFLVAVLDRRAHWRADLARIAAGALPMIALHVASFWALWGSVRLSGYAGEGFTAGWSGIVHTLFAARHGLFVYHVWYALALVACVAALTNPVTRRLAMGTLLSFVLMACINGTWWCWWFGDSFGNRAFIELIPALVVTVVLWLSHLAPTMQRRAVRGFVGATVVLACVNLLLWTGYVLRRFPPDGTHSVAQAYLWPAFRSRPGS